MKPIRVLIVDDEQPARQRLAALVEAQPDLALVATCPGGEAALDMLAATQPPVDLVLLDIQMPEMNGFAVLERLVEVAPEPMPMVVFVTAYDQYALQAFEAQAVDYLLKPYSDERFMQAIERARQFLQGQQQGQVEAQMRALLARMAPPANPSPSYVDRIVLKERGRAWLLPTEQIRWVGAAGVYVEIHTIDSQTHLHRAALSDMAAQLNPDAFVRIHRSHLVRLSAIVELLQDSHGDYTVVLDDRTMLKLSRSYRVALQERLGQAL
ncbi:MAG: LytTR family DNA-binding domain-containing protein [Rhodothermales bacterium]